MNRLLSLKNAAKASRSAKNRGDLHASGLSTDLYAMVQGEVSRRMNEEVRQAAARTYQQEQDRIFRAHLRASSSLREAMSSLKMNPSQIYRTYAIDYATKTKDVMFVDVTGEDSEWWS